MLDKITEVLTTPWYLYMDDYFESESLGVAFVLVLLAVSLVALWLWWDSYDFFDFMGATALLLAFMFISPLVLLAYLGAKGLAFAATWARTRSPREVEMWFRRYRHALRPHRLAPQPLTKRDLDAIAAIKIDTEITEAERDANIEEYLQSGQREEALRYVRDMLHVAKSMRDAKAVARYENYYLALRLGPPVSGTRRRQP